MLWMDMGESPGSRNTRRTRTDEGTVRGGTSSSGDTTCNRSKCATVTVGKAVLGLFDDVACVRGTDNKETAGIQQKRQVGKGKVDRQLRKQTTSRHGTKMREMWDTQNNELEIVILCVGMRVTEGIAVNDTWF